MPGATRALNYRYRIAVGAPIHHKLVPELRSEVFDELHQLSPSTIARAVRS